MFDALFQETLRIRQHGAEYRVKIPAAGILVGVIQNRVPPVVIQVPDHSSLCRQVEFPVVHIDQTYKSIILAIVRHIVVFRVISCISPCFFFGIKDFISGISDELSV